MGNVIKHNCGVAVAHTLSDLYDFLNSIQNRGRDAVGIVAVGENRIDAIKWRGLVSSFSRHSLHEIFDISMYHTFIGHVRYTTSGEGASSLDGAHPHVIGGEIIDNEDHIFIKDCDMAIVHNGHVILDSIQVKENSDSTSDTKKLLQYYKEKGEEEILKNIIGAYTLVIADKKKDEVMVLRDRTGIKPGALGFKNGMHVMVSEDCAIKNNHGVIKEDIKPGSVYYLDSVGEYRVKEVIEPKLKYCFFEYVYIANRESALDGLYVDRLRRQLGTKLAKEFNPGDIDLVSHIPNCPKYAAQEYAKEIGVDFKPIFYKRKLERSFLGANIEQRKKSIKSNMHIHPFLRDEIKGKTLLLLDDSIVRGNNSSEAISDLKKLGAKKIYFASYTPPVGITGKDGVDRGCMFGVDMPPTDAFIARGRNIDQISDIIGAEVVYLSLKGLFQTFEELGMKKENLCSYCIGGEHPFN